MQQIIGAYGANSPLQKRFVIFLKVATFLDFIETRLSNYKPQLSESAFHYSGGFFFNQVQTSKSSVSSRPIVKSTRMNPKFIALRSKLILTAYRLIQRHMHRLINNWLKKADGLLLSFFNTIIFTKHDEFENDLLSKIYKGIVISLPDFYISFLTARLR